MIAPFLVVGHRGAAARAPENTAASFRAAVEAGADAFEIDLGLTRDGRPACLHDATLDRTTSGKGRLDARSWDEVARLDAGSWFSPAFAGERVPSLEDALEIASGRCRVVVEIKDARAVEALVATLEGRGRRDDVVVSSFDWDSLAAVRRRLPDVAIAATVRRLERRNPVAFALSIGARAIHPTRALAAPALVARAHDAGLAVVPYTVNDDAGWARLLAAGADGAFTDDPAALVAFLSRGGAR